MAAAEGLPRIVVIAQARMDSSRLPGKVLLEAGGMPVLAQVLRRAAAIDGVAAVCCATSDRAIDDPIAATAAAYGAAVFRGSASDVLLRYRQAAQAMQADIVMRITCDCPLLDPAVCRDVLALQQQSGADYAANVLSRSWPHGCDCEVFPRHVLEQAADAATSDYDREHVTPWIRNNPALVRVDLPGPGGAAARQRWTLDYPEDYVVIRTILEAFAGHVGIPGWREVLAFVEQHPELAEINRLRLDPARLPADGPPVAGA